MKKKIVSQGPRVLMVGYNGANNTGAEALLRADVDDVRSVPGPEARITVPTLNEANLRRYLSPSPTLTIAPMSTLFFGAIRRMVKSAAAGPAAVSMDAIVTAERSSATRASTAGAPTSSSRAPEALRMPSISVTGAV